MFELMPPDRTGVDFQLQLPDMESYIREVIHLNVMGGVATGDFDGDGRTDFYVTNPTGGGRLYRNVGDFRFVDVTAEAGLKDEEFWGTGATFVDINNNGRLDLHVCGYRQPNRLYINEVGSDGKVRFVEQAARWRLDYDGASMTMAFADIDNNGRLDAFLATTALAPPPGTEFRVRFEGNKPVVLEGLREYWEIIYLPNDRAHRTEAGQLSRLYRNDGERFTDITQRAGIESRHFTLSAMWWDYNDDGLPDLYLANDFFGPDFLYRNNGDGTFTDVAADMLPHVPWFSMGTALGDITNNGLIDLLATDMMARTHSRRMLMRGSFAKSDWFLEIAQPRQYIRNALYVNSGGGRMMEAAFLANMAATDWTWAPLLADFDNDGRVDVFITNGIARDLINADLSDYADSTFRPNTLVWSRFWAQQPMFKEYNVALRNLGDLEFEDVGAAWGLDREGVSFGSATADFDNDGDLDLIVVNADAPLSIYRNQSDQGHRARIRLEGRQSNRFGIGAKIDLSAAGLRQTRYMTLASGYLSANEPVATFGLGDAASIDELAVTWPSGERQSFTDLPADRFYTITEPEPETGPSSPRTLAATSTSDVKTDLSPFPEFPQVEHHEEPFDDFELQPLLPWKLSELGPAMAWGDVNGDGLEDFYVGGSRGHPGRLFINIGRGYFEERSVAGFDADRECEDTAAVFFDATGNGHLDLYVVSGSVEHPPGDTAYRDRLYLNDGQGRFTRADDDMLPDLRDSGSIVAACDFNRNGRMDLFVGSRSVPGEYPLPPENRLLVNQGGRFEEQTPDALRHAGMVTDAVWADFNGDGWDDLAIATDWGPVRVFANHEGELVEKTAETGLAELLGWWQAVAAGDFNGDGRVDIVVTNIGLNTKYRASREQPELLFYGDFDDFGRNHILEAYYEGETLYPRRDRAALAEAMPGPLSKYETFDEFSTASLADIFTQQRLDRARRFEVNTLESGVLINEGNFRFRFVPFPRLAQIAPSLGVDVGDVNGDGHLDIVLAQNFYSPQRVTGRMDGGVSLLLLGDGQGGFQPRWPNQSGIVVPGDARKVRIIDIYGDGHPDLVFAVQNGPWRAFRNKSE